MLYICTINLKFCFITYYVKRSADFSNAAWYCKNNFFLELLNNSKIPFQLLKQFTLTIIKIYLFLLKFLLITLLLSYTY